MSRTWSQTYFGRRFDIADPHPVWDLEEIAHALSMKCRFGGHCTHFYSVAEHSVLVSQQCQQEHRKWGLLHDAVETYIPDTPKPMKRHRALEGLVSIEHKLMQQVSETWNLGPLPQQVKDIDYRILADERNELMRADLNELDDGWPSSKPLGVEIKCLSPLWAKAAFLTQAYELGLERHGTTSKT